MKHISTLLLFLATCSAINAASPIKTDIKGHWNYPPYSVHNIYVESEGTDVELLINGISFGHGKQETDSLFRFDNVIFLPGDLTAVSYDANGKELSRQTLKTAGNPAQMKLTVNENATGFRANGEDTAIIQFEITDFQGTRCGADDRPVSLEIEGPAEWMGAVSQDSGKRASEKTIKVENGINHAVIKSTKTPGIIKVTARTKGLAPVEVTLNSTTEQ